MKKLSTYTLPWRAGLIVWARGELNHWAERLGIPPPQLLTDRAEWLASHTNDCDPGRSSWRAHLYGECCETCWAMYVDIDEHDTRVALRDTIVHELCHLSRSRLADEVYVSRVTTMICDTKILPFARVYPRYGR